MKRNLWLVLLVSATLGLGLVACGDDEEESSGTDTGTDTGTGEGEDEVDISIEYAGESATVTIDALATSAIGDVEVVLISSILESSNLNIDLASVELDFEGTDGYRPSQKSFCADFLPTAGTNADKAGVNLADDNTIVWDESLAMDKCANVKDLGKIYVVDLAD